MNELYLEVKNKWKSLYPIYFDASKTIQEGILYMTKDADYPSSFASKNQLSSKLQEQCAHVNSAT